TGATTQAQLFAYLNLIPALAGNVTVLGAPGGPFTLVFNNAFANVNVPQMTTTVTRGTTGAFGTVVDGIGNELKSLSIGGFPTGTFTVSFNGVAATSPVTFTPSAAPTAAQVLAHLNTIPALNGNVSVVGGNGGPFFVAFKNALANVNVPQLTT